LTLRKLVSSFSSARDQAGYSREYGGIHFEDGDFEARKTGDLASQQVWTKAKTYFIGQSHRHHLDQTAATPAPHRGH
jgi:hypothetical protein